MNKIPTPRTFVLVHGAGHGAWAWRRVADLLRAAGHRVFAPTLTGLAERSHLMSDEITLETHILDVANLFKWEDIDSATLVAHSYGGWVVTGAAERLQGRLAALAYVDAFLPDEGQRGYDLLNAQQKAFLTKQAEWLEAQNVEMGKVDGPADAKKQLEAGIQVVKLDEAQSKILLKAAYDGASNDEIY